MVVRKTERQDFDQIRSIVIATDVFSQEEIDIAVELLDIYLNDPDQKDYELFSYIDGEGKVSGYICIGPTPATKSTYDLYWIAVDPVTQSKGVGTVLLNYTEDVLKKRGGRLLIAETSSISKYDNTRRFYEQKKFQKLAHIKEYYKENDDLIIYGKYL